MNNEIELAKNESQKPLVLFNLLVFLTFILISWQYFKWYDIYE